MDILQAIGNTSMVRLRKVVPPHCAAIFVKLEWENPTGSVKDRMAQAVISRAEQDGRLKPGDTVVEYTGGSTGTSLALVCAARGYRLHIVSSDAFSKEKRDHMAALGAELTLVPSEGGLTTKKLILAHDRSRSRVEPRAAHLLDRPAQQPGQHRGLPRAGRGDLEPDEGEGRRVRSLRRHGSDFARGRHRAEAIQAGHQDRRRRTRGILGACWAARQGLTRSKEWGLATLRRSGTRLSSTRSCRSRQTTQRRWRDVLRGRRPSSRERLPGPTSSPRFEWPSGSGRMPVWSR